MKEIWDALDGEDEDAQLETAKFAIASFILQHTGNDPFDSALVHFLAILGIDAEMDRLRTAKNYSYITCSLALCTARELSSSRLFFRRRSGSSKERKRESTFSSRGENIYRMARSAR